MDDLGLEYSVFYVARYTGGRKGRVIDAKAHNWQVGRVPVNYFPNMDG